MQKPMKIEWSSRRIAGKSVELFPLWEITAMILTKIQNSEFLYLFHRLSGADEPCKSRSLSLGVHLVKWARAVRAISSC